MGTIIDDLDSINANLYVLTDHIVNGSSSDLNNMEQDIASSEPLIVNVVRISDDEFSNTALDKTWQEIHDALLSSNVTIVFREIDEGSEFISVQLLSRVDYDSSLENPYCVVAADIDYTTNQANGYPRTHWTD